MSELFEFVDHCAAEYAFPIAKMCHWLEVSRSGFYEWRGRPESATAARRGELTAHVRRIFTESDQTYGYRRVHRQLGREGITAGPELVRDIMRVEGLVACQPRPWRHLTVQDATAAPLADLVGRDFTATRPGEKLVGDITYIRTWRGWVYLATVIDCYSRAVVGWAMADHYRTPLITAAITMAARNLPLTDDCVFHSDRGSNYTSDEFAGVLAELGIRQSVGRTGICFDNALAESFFASLKNELVHRTVYPTRQHAINDVARYIELRYNTRRIHSAIGYRTPQEALQAYWDDAQAA